MNKFLLASLCMTSVIYGNYNFYNQSVINHSRLGNSQLKVGVNLLAGKADHSYDSSHKKTTLLNVFGGHYANYLGIKQTGSTLSTIAPYSGTATPTWHVLDDLTTDTRGAITAGTNLSTYGQFDITGKLSSRKGSIDLLTPSYAGFYLRASLPFSTITFSEVTFNDLTPKTGNGGYNIIRGVWTNFLTSFDAILAEYNISRTKYDESGIEDLQVDLHYGYEFNDMFQADVEAGILFPTGKKKNEKELFSLPHGNDGHWGFKLGATAQANLHEYFSLQGSFEAVLFGSNKKIIHLKTYEKQDGFLFLPSGEVNRKKGAIINCEAHATLLYPDAHFSLSLGYLYTHSAKTTLTPTDTTLFNTTIINTDKRFASWYRHSIQGSAVVSINNPEDEGLNGELGFIFSIPVAGKNIFKTNGYGVETGITYSCQI